MADDLHVDMGELAREIKLVDKQFAKAIKVRLNAAVSEAGKQVVDAVKAEASWSTGTPRPRNKGKGGKKGRASGRTSIPKATSMVVAFTAQTAIARVKVDSRKAPHARPLEFGSKNGSGMNRHPVFHGIYESGAWVNQPVRPFFFAAVKAKTPEIEAKIRSAIDLVAMDAGFKGR